MLQNLPFTVQALLEDVLDGNVDTLRSKLQADEATALGVQWLDE